MTEENSPFEGQLRGVGLRLDPLGILFRPHDYDGKQWGFTLKPEEGQPMIYMNGEWTEFVPEGVWLQMKDLWEEMKSKMQENIDDVGEYLDYPELGLKGE